MKIAFLCVLLKKIHLFIYEQLAFKIDGLLLSILNGFYSIKVKNTLVFGDD